MNNTETKLVKIIPKQPRFISDILKLPARIDEEIQIELNIREIVRCMQYADIYDENDKPLTPIDIVKLSNQLLEEEKNDEPSEDIEPDVEDNNEEQQNSEVLTGSNTVNTEEQSKSETLDDTETV